MSGPLAGLTVVEFSGLGPAPLAGQLLADLGASVIAIDRRSAPPDPGDVNRRGKRSAALNLKQPGGLAAARRILAGADVLIEGFRPGVMERLGLGPGDLDDRLIYARMTGWGQRGPLSDTAGHDLNYLSLSGALAMIGPPDRPPVVPLNLVADFGGGTMFVIFGILAALFERQRSGRGQVVDASMIDGVPALMGLIHGMIARGDWTAGREANPLDGGAPFYRCYQTADDRFLSVAALEDQFFAEFLRLAGLPDGDRGLRADRRNWPGMCARYAAHFRTRTRNDWVAVFAGSDACVAPVLDFDEVRDHPHNRARGTFVDVGGVIQAAPAPRLGRTPAAPPGPPSAPGADTDRVLAEAGLDAGQIAVLRAAGDLT